MKKWILWTLILMLTTGAAASEAFSVEAKGAVLIDGNTGRILFGQNENERLPMASTTKIMTALVALENSSLDETVTAGKNASGVEGTSIYLSVGEELSMEHMLYGLMLRSGNDAAVAIAEHVAGSVPEFAEMMNRRAEELDADARFVNPHGLTAEGHETSALGLARILREAMTIPEFRTITATTRKVIPWVGNEYSRVLENKNRLLTSYEGANGGKTGYTSKAGRCLAFSAERDGLWLVGAVLGCPTWFDTAEAMLDYGFENFRSKALLEAGQTVGSTSLSGGTSRQVLAAAAENLTVALPVGTPYTLRYTYSENLAAPVRKGDIIGDVSVQVRGETVARCDLVAVEDVRAWTFLESLHALLRRWPAV